MVAPVADVADELLPIVGVDVCRRDESDVGQVGAAEVGIVENDDVSGLQAIRERAEGGLNGSRHGPQMHRLVRGLRHHFGGGIEQRAGKVLALLHVGGVAGALERHAHLLGDGDEHVLENFQADGVNWHGG